MTARQQRRLEQKLARKAAKRAHPQAEVSAQPAPSLERSDRDSRSLLKDAGQANLSQAGDKGLNNLQPARGQICLSHSVFQQAPRPVSEAKIIANRANAQLSTGATTEAGKAVVSQNAAKHGLTGKFKVLPSESQSEFDQLLAGFLKSEAPVGDEEIEMVHQMTEALWLSRRSLRLQNGCFDVLESGTPEEQRAVHKSLTLYMRYQTTQDRTFLRYLTELRKRRNERGRTERGFVSQKLKLAVDRRREELHRMRQELQNAKLEGQEIRNRLAAAKAEAVELKNLARKTQLTAQNSERGLAAAA